MLLDEPVTGLDPRHQLEAMELLRTLAASGSGAGGCGLEGRPCAMTAAVMTSKPVQSRRGIDCWYVGTVYRRLRHVGGRAV
jgi:hypothetical protein